jgi:ubiquinone/menaquinone biosynthesis C-methylase UbiE
MGRSKFPSTDIVQDQQNGEELQRLAVQDQMLAETTRGTLPWQEDGEQLEHALDVGCGVGGWVIETAQRYPHMFLVGIDINQHMIDYAQAQAVERGVSERVSFQVMDALTLPGLANASFDLVNQRIGVSYLRTWDWPRVLREMVRVARPGGIVQLTEPEVVSQSNSEAFQQMAEMLMQALYASHHLFKPEPAGIIPYLKTFLEEQRCRDIHVQSYKTEYHAGTVAGNVLYQEVASMTRLFRPFIQKWGDSNKKNHDILTRQMLKDMQQPGFKVTSSLTTAWGRTPG